MNAVKKEQLSEDTIIGSRKITAAEYRKFFKKALGEDYEQNAVAMDVIKASLNHKGKSLKVVMEECLNPPKIKNLDETLSENRFKIISAADIDFIKAFDKVMNEMGYDYGGTVSGNMEIMAVIYGKTGTKNRICPARIHIDNGGKISLRFYLHKVDEHRQFIENAPTYIKDLFINSKGQCTGCNFKDGKCKYKCTKTYTVNGRLYNKCYFSTDNPSADNIPYYRDIILEFYPMKKIKRTE